jgi:hypothetical protein
MRLQVGALGDGARAPTGFSCACRVVNAHLRLGALLALRSFRAPVAARFFAPAQRSPKNESRAITTTTAPTI